MNSELFYNKLVNSGVNISLEELNEIISKIDIESIKEDLSKSYRLEIWDKKSPINGIKAETVLKSKSYTIGNVYLIYINDKQVDIYGSQGQHRTAMLSLKLSELPQRIFFSLSL